jgi:hypothetical protein
VKTKWNLNKSGQRAHCANVERLKSGGIAIGLENEASSEPPLLRFDQSEYSFIHAGTRKGIALVLCVRLIPLKSGVTLLDYCGITIPGCDDANFFLVQPPEGSLSYKVFGWLDLDRGSVLNHLIFTGRPLPCGKIFDGILVAQSFDSLPSQFQRGKIQAEICLVDQLGNPYKSEVELRVQRYSQGGEHAKKGHGLYAPKQGVGSRLQPQVHAHPSSAVRGAVIGGKEKTADIASRG